MDSPRELHRQKPHQHPHTLPSSPTVILLKPGLWFDAALATLVYADKTILLTAHEAAVLRVLLQPPYTWHTARDLARHLRKASKVRIAPHSIQQTISGLRRKLGESARQQYLLLSHYGHGYCLAPQGIDYQERESPTA